MNDMNELSKSREIEKQFLENFRKLFPQYHARIVCADDGTLFQVFDSPGDDSGNIVANLVVTTGDAGMSDEDIAASL